MKTIFQKLFRTRTETAAQRTGTRRILFSFFILLLSPIVTFQCAEWFTHNPWTIMTFPVALWNILFYELVYLLLFFLTGRIRPALLIGNFLFLVFSLANYFVVQFRSAPIVPWDFYSIGTAASVAGDYKYELTPQAAVCIAVYVLLFVLAFLCRGRIRNVLWRFAAAALVCLGIFGYIQVLHTDSFMKSMKLDQTLFTPYFMSRKDGMTTAFLIDLKFLRVEQPDGYSAEAEAAFLEEYETPASKAASSADSESLPNIIVIMDEAFSDPAILGDFETNTDYMPFVHSLQQGAENTITGLLNVSVRGGNTANTEYEFLTGHSMRFLPAGSVPFQQYIFGEKDSVSAWLKSLGYGTTAIHPYNSKGWNRDKVYPWLGFDTFLYNKHFPGANRIRKYIDDESCFQKILELLKNKEENNPLFIFAVTMQNHSGYFTDFDNFTVDVNAAKAGSRTLDRYLSLIKLSDEALERLIHELSGFREKTILIFFGDHQPNDVVVRPVWKLHGVDDTSLTEEQDILRNQVPYLIWSNFDIEEETGTETSVNYLALELLERAGVPLSPFLLYQKEIREVLPVIAGKKLAAADGRTLSKTEEAASEELLSYRKVQYYRMFDQ